MAVGGEQGKMQEFTTAGLAAALRQCCQHRPYRMMKTILFLIPYFGRFPEWFPLYLESCRWNPTVDWLFFTDCKLPENAPPNVRFMEISFHDYQRLVSARLGIEFTIVSPYKLCDLKPALGAIHQEYLDGYDFFGFSDVDVIYGDLRAFYTADALRHNTISTHKDLVSGHLFLMRNGSRWIDAFRRIPRWKEKMCEPKHLSLDEDDFTKVLRGRKRMPHLVTAAWGLFDSHKRNHMFVEQHSTVLAEFPWKDGSFEYPDAWYWREGKLTTASGEQFMYLHFMNWKSGQYLLPRYGSSAAWESLPRLIDPALTNPEHGFSISAQGFLPLSPSVAGT